MGRLRDISLITGCVVIAVLLGYLLHQGGQRGTGTDSITAEYTLEQTELVNLAETAEGLIAGEDPQIILADINCQVDSIFLVGMELSEEVQIFFTEGEEGFSEEKSIKQIPELMENGTILQLGKKVTSLRIDFAGGEGSCYTISGILLTLPEAAAWSVEGAALCIVIGLLIGGCLLFLLREGRNFGVYLQALKKYRYLLEDMVLRDIKLKYRRSVIGLLWSVLNPLLMMVVLTAVFQNLFRFSVENFAVYYLTGWLIFNFITEATTGAMTSVLGAGALIRKVYIPKYIFPMQKCIFSFVNMIFSLIALIVVMLVLRVRIAWSMLLIPIPLILALIFSVGVGMILATAAVFLRDVIHLYGVFTMVWMYLTPIIYPEEILTGMMQTVMRLNPLYYFVSCFRKITLYGSMPGMTELIIMGSCSVVSLLLGAAVFKKKQDRFILFI